MSRKLLPAIPSTPAVVPIGRKSRPGASRQRRVEELRRGNQNAWRHGADAIVANLPDISTEIALQFAARPALDAIRDYRLVEEVAINVVQRRRAVIALQDQGQDGRLGARDSQLAALVERGEHRLHERERERVRERREPVDLSAYAPGEVRRG